MTFLGNGRGLSIPRAKGIEKPFLKRHKAQSLYVHLLANESRAVLPLANGTNIPWSEKYRGSHH